MKPTRLDRRSFAAMALALTLLGLPMLSACGDTPLPSQMPQDFSVTYEWREGSLPPPHHYEYTVAVGPGAQGKMSLRPDYPSDAVPVWSENFTVTGDQMQALYKTVRDKNLFRDPWPKKDDGRVGGSNHWAVITSGGKQSQTPTEPHDSDQATLNEFYEQVKALVPKQTWNKLMAQREEYKNAREP
jgi:hypothetical protein